MGIILLTLLILFVKSSYKSIEKTSNKKHLLQSNLPSKFASLLAFFCLKILSVHLSKLYICFLTKLIRRIFPFALFIQQVGFFICYLAVPRQTLGHYLGNSLTHLMLMLICAFLLYKPETL